VTALRKMASTLLSRHWGRWWVCCIHSQGLFWRRWRLKLSMIRQHFFPTLSEHVTPKFINTGCSKPTSFFIWIYPYIACRALYKYVRINHYSKGVEKDRRGVATRQDTRCCFMCMLWCCLQTTSKHTQQRVYRHTIRVYRLKSNIADNMYYTVYSIADNIKAYTTAGVQTYNQGLPLEIEHTDNIYR
jgi:hypothetical protein